MDVQVAKDATPQVQLVNGQATVSYTVRVKNNGPNQAHNVTVADAAPSGVTFVWPSPSRPRAAVARSPAASCCSAAWARSAPVSSV